MENNRMYQLSEIHSMLLEGLMRRSEQMDKLLELVHQSEERMNNVNAMIKNLTSIMTFIIDKSSANEKVTEHLIQLNKELLEEQKLIRKETEDSRKECQYVRGHLDEILSKALLGSHININNDQKQL